MSTEVNSQLFTRASEMVDQWEGTLVAKLIEHDLEINDLDALALHVAQAENLSSQENFHANDCI